jgi:hypothetical protein
MYIVYEHNNEIDSLRSKYLVLELDTLEFSGGKTVKAFVVIDREHIPLEQMPHVESLVDLHEHLIKNYRLQNWNYCRQAMDHLRGKFKGEVDTFYDALAERITILENGKELPEDWTGNVITEQTLDSE